MSHRTAVLVFLGLVALASALRFPLLAERPMHCDEAVHADKFGVLLEEGRYEYSTVDFHGPTLYDLTLLTTRAQGVRHYTDLNEVMLRSIPAIAGVLLVAGHALLIPYIGFPAALSAALLTAVSPAMVYYSRYYIHEMLLVLLTLCILTAALHYCRKPGAVTAVVSGVLLGLMYATKETTILAVAGMLLAGAALWLHERRGEGISIPFSKPPFIRHLVIAAGVSIFVGFALLSSFFSHPRGFLDSIVALRTYLERGSGVNTFHVHPWNYYFDLWFYYHSGPGPVWTEALIAILALIGIWAAFSRKRIAGLNVRVLRFLVFYAVFMVLIYSALPYKAPWNILGPLHGLILVAGAGTAALWQAAAKRTPRVAILIILGAGVLHLGWQAWSSSVPYGADPRNPWVYAHTGNDVFAITKELESLASVHPSGRALPIQIISRENLWPMPWYLRRFTGVRWWNGVSETAPNAPVILATPDMEPAIIRKLYDLPPPGKREMYVSMFEGYIELRPRVEIRGYVLKSLLDELQQLKASNEIPSVGLASR